MKLKFRVKFIHLIYPVGREDVTSITRIRKMGKDALKANNLEMALEIYTEGLAVCSDKGDLKEISMLYTNKATVYSKLGQHDLALKDAESAIQSDPTRHKVWTMFCNKGDTTCSFVLKAFFPTSFHETIQITLCAP